MIRTMLKLSLVCFVLISLSGCPYFCFVPGGGGCINSVCDGNGNPIPGLGGGNNGGSNSGGGACTFHLECPTGGDSSSGDGGNSCGTLSDGVNDEEDLANCYLTWCGNPVSDDHLDAFADVIHIPIPTN